MRYAKIQSGTVVNVELWAEQPTRDGYEFVPLADDSPVGIRWQWDGSDFIEPEPLPPVVPELVTQAQFRLAVLTLHGADTARVAAAVEAVALALPVQDQEAARLRWIYTERAVRTDETLVAVCGELGLSSAQIDAVFILAATL